MTRTLTLLIVLLAAAGVPAQAHDHYTSWKIPGTTSSCCNNTDCDVVTIHFVNGVRHVRWRGQSLPAPDSALLDQPSHDTNSHACVIAGQVRCLVIGGGV